MINSPPIYLSPQISCVCSYISRGIKHIKSEPEPSHPGAIPVARTEEDLHFRTKGDLVDAEA